MKQLDPAAMDRMKKEVRILQEINHPNVVTLFDVYPDGAQWFFTMELVEGRPFPGDLTRSGSDGPNSITIDEPSFGPGEFIAESQNGEQSEPSVPTTMSEPRGAVTCTSRPLRRRGNPRVLGIVTVMRDTPFDSTHVIVVEAMRSSPSWP